MDETSLEEWVTRDVLDGALLIAPPGCGKTEALARRADYVVRSGLIGSPQQILALTYSRKATDNLGSRMRKHLGTAAGRHVVTTNFHRLATRLLHCHGNVIGRPASGLIPQSTSDQRRLLREVAREHNIAERDLEAAVTAAKDGVFSDDDVFDRLEGTSPAALDFEHRLRQRGGFDYTDQLRLATLILENPCVRRLYQRRFPYVLVDEAQDISELQFELIRRLAADGIAFAGDRAQGIFDWAGAAPDTVYPEIERRSSVRVALRHSYRSAPAIVRVVDWAGRELGGEGLEVAPDAEWEHDGHVEVHRFQTDTSEAEWVVRHCRDLLDGKCSVGVLTRSKARLGAIQRRLEQEGIAHQNWDQPAQRPDVIALLRRFAARTTNEHGDGADALEELYLRCLGELTAEDGETLLILADAIEDLRDSVEQKGLTAVIAQLQQVWDAEDPVPAGIHLSTGHKGKGQQFDHVVLVGLEEESLPSYFALRDPNQDKAISGELAVLHVLLSRPKLTLVMTCCSKVWSGGKLRRRQPSRWLAPLEERSTSSANH